MLEEPPGSALTLTIKEQTISVKHVFSAFTLYANVLRRVKVPFDEAQQEFIGKSIHWNLPKKKKKRLATLKAFSGGWKLTFRDPSMEKFPWAGSFESAGGFFAYSTVSALCKDTRGIVVSEKTLDIGIPRLKLTRQHTDGKRREESVR